MVVDINFHTLGCGIGFSFKNRLFYGGGLIKEDGGFGGNTQNFSSALTSRVDFYDPTYKDWRTF